MSLKPGDTVTILGQGTKVYWTVYEILSKGVRLQRDPYQPLRQLYRKDLLVKVHKGVIN